MLALKLTPIMSSVHVDDYLFLFLDKVLTVVLSFFLIET